MRYWCVLAACCAVGADDGRVRALMTAGEVPGFSAAVVRNGKLTWEGEYGLMNTTSAKKVTKETIFQAASLTKPVFAYAVMKLVEAGRLDLDAPLSKWLPDYMPKGDASQKITARQVLSHSTGLPNWRRPNRDLKSHFEPGERFSYSGEGYVYLSKVIEKITGEGLEQYMRSAVFAPLDMKDSSLVWQDAFESRMASGHDGIGTPFPIMKGKDPNAAASLLTTAGDFGRFIAAAVEGRGLKPQTAALMWKPHSTVKFACGECLAADRKPYEGDIGWALGWGVDRNSGREDYFQWGDNGIYKALVVVSPKKRDGVVLFMNSVSGLSIAEDLVQELLGRQTAVLRWLRYERYDSPRRKLTRAIVSEGLTPANRTEVAKLEPSDRSTLAGDLFDRGRRKESIEIGEKACAEAPTAPAHARLADAYLVTGDYPKAAQHFREAFKLDPNGKYFSDMADLIDSGKIARPSTEGNVTFRLKGYPSVRAVYVAGSFNRGHRRQLPLQKNAEGIWEVRVAIPPGKYTYNFFVDGETLPHPENPRQEEAGGRKSSVLIVPETGAKLPHVAFQDLLAQSDRLRRYFH